jgi:DNA recombination protein Rad52
MAFTDTQVRLLKAKLDPRYIRTRSSNGCTLSYVEGWYAIAEANRIFGYEAWDRRTVSASCVWTEAKAGQYRAVYTAKVRITVRAAEVKVVREGSGSCEATAATAGQAHELALKGAETDATKRALATFGNPFGLALYDKDQAGVRKQRGVTEIHSRPWVLRSASGSSVSSYDTPASFIASLRQAMTEARDIELLYDLWEQNVDTLRTLQRYSKEEPGIVPKLVAHLRLCAVGLVKQAGASQASEKRNVARSDERVARRIIDKSTLAISEPKRIRCKEHLRYVASQPCVICGRSPSHAHHVRYAQRRGLGIKVSDEFAVPLCATHHHQLHNTTKEREWWQERKIDPLMIAGRLWRESQKRGPDTAEAITQEPIHSVSDASTAPTESSTP